jgi:uncharacterized protein YbjT (DUF2867 family)
MRRIIMRIAVAGSTGRVGRHVVDVLKAEGQDVVPMSRSGGVDVITREGLANALIGVDRIIDVAGWPSPDQKAATEFFTTAALHLHEEGRRAGVQRIIAASIIGIDRFTAGYMAAKVAHEKALRAGPIPVRILRAAQFHELVEQFVEWGRQGIVIAVPWMRLQPIAARTVAHALVELALETESAPPHGDAPTLEIAGPRPENLVDLAKLIASRRGDPSRVEAVTDPADPDAALYEAGALLPGPHTRLAGPTFEEWLASTPAGRRVERVTT